MTASVVRSSGFEAYNLIYPEHLALLSDNDRDAMLKVMIGSNHIWIGWDDDKVLCVWGLIAQTLLSDRAYLWLYTTSHLQEHSFIFVRRSRMVVEDMLKSFPIINGHAMVGADKSIRWLRWLGAKFGTPEGRLIPFEIRAKYG